MTFSLQTIDEFLGSDMDHIEHVVNLSVQLFKQLRVLHKFPRQYLKILKIAAYLCDTGKKIGFYNYEKNTAHIILSNNIFGVSHRDIVMAAFVSANTSIEDINMSEWARYKELICDEDIEAVKKMGVMLRLANSLDRGLSKVVKGINCDILGDSVIMKTEVEGDASLEINSALEIGSDFRKVFKKNLEIL